MNRTKNIKVDLEVWKLLKLKAIQEDKTLSQVILEIVRKM